MTKTAKHIAEHGWGVIMIPADDVGPSFAYTVGLWVSFHCAELFMQGLPIDVMHAILNDAGAMIRAGARFAPGSDVHELIDGGHPCGVRQFPRSKYDAYLGQAIEQYAGVDFDALQLTWPDRNGRLPDDEHCVSEVRRQQELAELTPRHRVCARCGSRRVARRRRRRCADTET